MKQTECQHAINISLSVPLAEACENQNALKYIVYQMCIIRLLLGTSRQAKQEQSACAGKTERLELCQLICIHFLMKS